VSTHTADHCSNSSNCIAAYDTRAI